jgi:hypothetical protein
MGLLDEAIREHLDLKRRRGADPDEIERAEREALGPVRRQPEQAEADQPVAAEPDQALEAAAGEAPEPSLEAEVPNAPEVEEHYAADIAPVPEPTFDEEQYESPPPVSAVPPPPRAPGPETAEYDVEQEHREDELKEPGTAEDVLEETPEFLQDTPDHDRLWFEQRPPKDFDFEGDDHR